MTLWVRALGSYRADIDSKWRDKDFLVRNIVKALKGETFNGYSNFRISGKEYRIDAKKRDAAFLAWANWAGLRIRDDLGLGNVTLVPIPASTQVSYDQLTTPLRMAVEISRVLPKRTSVGAFLKHREVQPSSHGSGGSRNAALIEKALDCKVTNTRQPVVLIDDVYTTGGHARAAASLLRNCGLTVEHLLVAGRTVWTEVPNPLKVDPENIESEKL